MTGSRYISLILSTAILLGPTAVYAQGFSFGNDEVAAPVESEPDKAPDESTDIQLGNADQSGMVFDTNDLKKTEEKKKRAVVSVIAIPGKKMTPALRKKIEAKMNEVLEKVPDNDYIGSEVMLAALQEHGLLECVRAQLCLGNAALDNNIDQVLYARILPSQGGGDTLEIDLFDAKDKLVLQYGKKENLKGTSAILDSIEPLINSIFNVRKERKKDFVNENNSLVSPIVSWTSLGVALALAGTGAYFTYSAYKGDQELQEGIDSHTISQVDADTKLKKVKADQTISYIAYGLGGAFAIVSAIFFSIDIGGDVSDEQGDSATASIRNLKLGPVFAPDSAGIYAGFNF